MPKFKILCTMEIDLYAIVEAPDKETAYTIGREGLDGGVFREGESNGGDWNVYDAIEYEGEEEADNIF